MPPVKLNRKNGIANGLFWTLAVGLLFSLNGCKKSGSDKQNTSESTEQSNRELASEENETLLERTGEVIRDATDKSMQAAGDAGNWIKDKVQGSYESGKEATINAGNAIRDMFQRAKEKGTTTAKNVIEYVKEDIAKLGAWQYTSRTVTNEDPNAVVKMLNQLGAEKWECFWVDKQEAQTTMYFKKSPRSYVNSIPFKDLIRYLPELGQDGQ